MTKTDARTFEYSKVVKRNIELLKQREDQHKSCSIRDSVGRSMGGKVEKVHDVLRSIHLRTDKYIERDLYQVSVKKNSGFRLPSQ